MTKLIKELETLIDLLDQNKYSLDHMLMKRTLRQAIEKLRAAEEQLNRQRISERLPKGN